MYKISPFNINIEYLCKGLCGCDLILYIGHILLRIFPRPTCLLFCLPPVSTTTRSQSMRSITTRVILNLRICAMLLSDWCMYTCCVFCFLSLDRFSAPTLDLNPQFLYFLSLIGIGRDPYRDYFDYYTYFLGLHLCQVEIS